MLERKALPWLLLAGVTTAAAAALWIQHGRLRREALARDQAEARADRQIEVLGADVKRVLQFAPRLDAIDQALKTRPVIAFNPIIRFEPTRQTAESPVLVDTAGVRHAHLDVGSDSSAIEGSVNVAVPAPPDPARWSLQLGVKPIQPVFRIRCARDAGAGGVRRAYLTADSLPPWAKIDLGLPQADPEVCSPAPPAFGFRLNVATTAALGGATLLGVLIGMLAF